MLEESNEHSTDANGHLSDEYAGAQRAYQADIRHTRWLFGAGLVALVSVAAVGLGGQLFGLQSISGYAHAKGRIESAEAEHARIARQITESREAAASARAEAAQAQAELDDVGARLVEATTAERLALESARTAQQRASRCCGRTFGGSRGEGAAIGGS